MKSDKPGFWQKPGFPYFSEKLYRAAELFTASQAPKNPSFSKNVHAA
jgi:hypothetical protein